MTDVVSFPAECCFERDGGLLCAVRLRPLGKIEENSLCRQISYGQMLGFAWDTIVSIGTP